MRTGASKPSRASSGSFEEPPSSRQATGTAGKRKRNSSSIFWVPAPAAERETEADPENPYAWFNLGANRTYFENYIEATDAFDKARKIGLPQRMLRYQFSPFIAYFHSGQIDDLITLTEYALDVTPNAEEALLWHGWGLYRMGKTQEAVESFQKALVENPNYQDAQYALNYVQGNP